MRKFGVYFFGLLSAWCIFSVFLLAACDAGAKITQDGFPTTSASTYIFLWVSAIASGIIAGIIEHD